MGFRKLFSGRSCVLGAKIGFNLVFGSQNGFRIEKWVSNEKKWVSNAKLIPKGVYTWWCWFNNWFLIEKIGFECEFDTKRGVYMVVLVPKWVLN